MAGSLLIGEECGECAVNEKILDDLLISRDYISGGFVLDAKKITVKGYSGAFNPSLIETKEGMLLSFRYQPLPMTLPSVSNIYLVFVDDNFCLKGEPQCLDTREYYTKVPSQSEDARLFSFENDIWVMYNDNTDSIGCSPDTRRDMYIARVQCNNGSFYLSCPLKLKHQTKWINVLWQKNWTPFEWDGNLLITYTIWPHEVLHVDFRTGICEPICKTPYNLKWNYGQLRGGTPTVLLGNEYFGFMHSSKLISTPYSFGKLMHQYFMGVYTFSSSPPFEITKMSAIPIMNKEIYSPSPLGKKVVFPGGFVIKGDKIYLAIGKDDSEIWILTLDKEKVMNSLMPIENEDSEL